VSAASVPTAPSGPLSKRDQAKTRKVKRRAANQEAGDKAEQVKDTEARQRRRAASQAAGDRTEREKNTEARQRKRAANQAAGDRTEQEKSAAAMKTRRAEIWERRMSDSTSTDISRTFARTTGARFHASSWLLDHYPVGAATGTGRQKGPTATSPTRGCR